MRKSIARIFVLIAIFSSANSNCPGQADSVPIRRNLAEVFYSRASSADGVQPAFGSTSYTLSAGFDFLRLFGQRRWGLEASAYYWGWSNLKQTGELREIGQLANSQSYFYALTAHWPLLHDHKAVLYASAGANLRTGSESFVADYWFHHIGWLEWIAFRKQRDLGLSLGTRFTWFPFWRFALSADLRYTRFVLRYYKPNPAYEFDNGTSKNLLMGQVKVGFCF